MKRALTFVFVLGFTCCLYAQAVDTTVCEILNNPQSFNGKTVRIKGTVVAGFDQFVVKGADCGINVNKNIWLSYPEGTKAKAGPAAMVQIQPARNFTGDVPAVQRTAVALDKNSKDFKLFDSQLATPYNKGGMCLGCNKFLVTAMLVGRLDSVQKAGVQRDSAGKIVGFGGFGHMYPAVEQEPRQHPRRQWQRHRVSGPTRRDAKRPAAAGRRRTGPLSHGPRLVETFEESILPDAKRTVKLLQQGYEVGELELVRLLEAQRALFQANLDYIDAQQARLSAAADLANLLQLERFP